MLMLIVLALVGLAAAVYAHLNLAAFIATPSGIMTTRVILLVVGLAFGYAAAISYMEGVPRWLAFIAGFGVVHIPPAVVLMIKRARHSPKS